MFCGSKRVFLGAYKCVLGARETPCRKYSLVLGDVFLVPGASSGIYFTVQVREAGRMGEGDHLLETTHREERRRQEQVDT